MSSSREVTVKKKDVWEQAGDEFYQESYPSGSKPLETTHVRRPSRLALPLPSYTARRGSILQGRNHKSAARRKQSVTANTGLTYTSTMAAVDANGTTTNANDIQVAILPDLSEETILNESKTWEELLRIKAMPVPMAQKKQLKAQLTNLPKLRLKGWSHIRWEIKKTWQNFQAVLTRRYRHTVFLHDSLRTIELRSGTSIVNVFLFIKWTLFLNLAISLSLILFIIGPYVVHDLVQGGKRNSTANSTTCSIKYENLTTTALENHETFESFIDCCRSKYEAELNNVSSSRGTVTGLFRQTGLGNFETWPVSFSFYHDFHISYNSSVYHFDAAYVLTAFAIFFASLILMVKSIAGGVKDVIQLREGEFYKYSNLIFGGWDHYTNDQPGAEFKRRVLRNEMKIALQTEKKKINDLLITRKQRVKIYVRRVLVNITVVILIIIAAASIFEAANITIELKDEQKFESGSLTDLAAGFIPSVVISIFNLAFPIILLRLGKLEQVSKEWETTLILIRALTIRLFSVLAAAFGFYRQLYCVPVEGFCVLCNEEHRSLRRKQDRTWCWENVFADQIYRLIFTDLIIKILITFIMDPIRRLIRHCCKNRVAQRIGRLNFNIVRHCLDVIYIQVLSWMSFYFAPFVPIVAVIYCFLMFYIKKFSVLYNCSSVPDTFRTTRTTIMFMIAKIISFVVVLFIFVFIAGFMVPSRECGPFRGKTSAWVAVHNHFENYQGLNTILEKVGSPGIAVPITLVLILLTYYYYSVAQANRAMVETLRHLLILEGHDKQYLFAKLNSLRRKSQSNSPTTEDGLTLNQP